MYRQAPVKARDMDFVTDLAEIEADSYEEAPPKNFGEKAWQWLVSILRSTPRNILMSSTDVNYTSLSFSNKVLEGF